MKLFSVFAATVSIGLALASGSAQAQGLPNLVQVPQALDLGTTTFFAGFGAIEPGWALLQTERASFNNRISDANGNNSPAFKNPRVNVYASVNQLVYQSPITIGAGQLGISAILPISGFDTHFDSPGLNLQARSPGFGDLTVGPFYQSFPILQDGHPFFVYRLALDTTAPIGAFSSSKDINVGSGFWSINPSISATLLPTSKFEISTKLNYIYNFQTNRFSNPPPIPFFTFQNGQAGQAVYGNFAASYEVLDALHLGVAGYFMSQLNDNRLNGMDLANTKVQELYIGPGAHYNLDTHNVFDVNVFLPTIAKNVPAGPGFGVRWVHVF